MLMFPNVSIFKIIEGLSETQNQGERDPSLGFCLIGLENDSSTLGLEFIKLAPLVLRPLDKLNFIMGFFEPPSFRW